MKNGSTANISTNKPGKISKDHRGNHKNVTDKAGKTTIKRLFQLEPLESISVLQILKGCILEC